jgi:hypothetical protein
MGGTYLTILGAMAAQAESVAKVVGDAYERNALVASVIMLVLAVVALFGLLGKSWRDRAIEQREHAHRLQDVAAQHTEQVKHLSEAHLNATSQRQEVMLAEFREKDTRMVELIERVVTVNVDVNNTMKTLIELVKERR